MAVDHITAEITGMQGVGEMACEDQSYDVVWGFCL